MTGKRRWRSATGQRRRGKKSQAAHGRSSPLKHPSNLTMACNLASFTSLQLQTPLNPWYSRNLEIATVAFSHVQIGFLEKKIPSRAMNSDTPNKGDVANKKHTKKYQGKPWTFDFCWQKKRPWPFSIISKLQTLRSPDLWNFRPSSIRRSDVGKVALAARKLFFVRGGKMGNYKMHIYLVRL